MALLQRYSVFACFLRSSVSYDLLTYFQRLILDCSPFLLIFGGYMQVFSLFLMFCVYSSVLGSADD